MGKASVLFCLQMALVLGVATADKSDEAVRSDILQITKDLLPEKTVNGIIDQAFNAISGSLNGDGECKQCVVGTYIGVSAFCMDTWAGDKSATNTCLMMVADWKSSDVEFICGDDGLRRCVKQSQIEPATCNTCRDGASRASFHICNGLFKSSKELGVQCMRKAMQNIMTPVTEFNCKVVGVCDIHDDDFGKENYGL